LYIMCVSSHMSLDIVYNKNKKIASDVIFPVFKEPDV